MFNDAQIFTQKGYISLQQAHNSDDIETLEKAKNGLYAHSEQLLKAISESGETLTEFYNKNTNELIVVPEIDNANKVCCYEYISGYSAGGRLAAMRHCRTSGRIG
jgi:hypothetical protein